jgi:predicted secreted protein
MKILYFIFVLLIFVAWECGDSALVSENMVGLDINGKNLVYEKNNKFILELDVHADGGYQWFKNISDTNVIRIDSIRYRPKGDKNLVGGMTVETFFFKTLKHGASAIELIEKRGWEKDIAPINKIYFTVNVK